jgi:hypothetical protein
MRAFLIIALATAALAYQDYPEITLVGKPKLEFGTAPEDYIDPGAQCYDPVSRIQEQRLPPDL